MCGPRHSPRVLSRGRARIDSYIYFTYSRSRGTVTGQEGRGKGASIAPYADSNPTRKGSMGDPCSCGNHQPVARGGGRDVHMPPINADGGLG